MGQTASSWRRFGGAQGMGAPVGPTPATASCVHRRWWPGHQERGTEPLGLMPAQCPTAQARVAKGIWGTWPTFGPGLWGAGRLCVVMVLQLQLLAWPGGQEGRRQGLVQRCEVDTPWCPSAQVGPWAVPRRSARSTLPLRPWGAQLHAGEPAEPLAQTWEVRLAKLLVIILQQVNSTCPGSAFLGAAGGQAWAGISRRAGWSALWGVGLHRGGGGCVCVRTRGMRGGGGCGAEGAV